MLNFTEASQSPVWRDWFLRKVCRRRNSLKEQKSNTDTKNN